MTEQRRERVFPISSALPRKRKTRKYMVGGELTCPYDILVRCGPRLAKIPSAPDVRIKLAEAPNLASNVKYRDFHELQKNSYLEPFVRRNWTWVTASDELMGVGGEEKTAYVGRADRRGDTVPRLGYEGTLLRFSFCRSTPVLVLRAVWTQGPATASRCASGSALVTLTRCLEVVDPCICFACSPRRLPSECRGEIFHESGRS